MDATLPCSLDLCVLPSSLVRVREDILTILTSLLRKFPNYPEHNYVYNFPANRFFQLTDSFSNICTDLYSITYKIMEELQGPYIERGAGPIHNSIFKPLSNKKCGNVFLTW